MAGHEHDMHLERLHICRRIVEHARNGTTDMAPGVMLHDIAAYTDPQRLELEMEKLFRGMPQVVCLARDLPEPGSFRLFDDAGMPLYVVRGTDGRVRAFLNICPHRGARLIAQPSGCKPRVSCRFHGWTFDTDGKARIPQAEHFCGLGEAQTSLTEFPAEERHGLVWVRPNKDGALDLDAHLAAFGSELDKLDLEQYERVSSDIVRARANWKYTFDTYFENYHFAVLHRKSLAPLYINNIMLCDSWGPHHRLVFPPREIHEWSSKPESQWKVDTIATPYFVFPNTILYLGALNPDELFLNVFRMYPDGIGALVTHVETYVPHGSLSEAVRSQAEQTHAGIVKLLIEEDYEVTSEAWPHLRVKSAGSKLIFGRQEVAVQHFHQAYCRALGVPEPQVVMPQEALLKLETA